MTCCRRIDASIHTLQKSVGSKNIKYSNIAVSNTTFLHFISSTQYWNTNNMHMKPITELECRKKLTNQSTSDWKNSNIVQKRTCRKNKPINRTTIDVIYIDVFQKLFLLNINTWWLSSAATTNVILIDDF